MTYHVAGSWQVDWSSAVISGGSSTTHVDPDRLLLPDLNAGSGASKRSQAALVVEVLDGRGLGCLL